MVSRSLSRSMTNYYDSNSTCTICLNQWTLNANHSICCLKCGHLFGRSCIARWLQEQGNESKCPICNKRAKKADIRNLWCKSIKATDNSELNRLKELLDNEKKLRALDSSQFISIINGLNSHIDSLYREISSFRRNAKEKDKKISRSRGFIAFLSLSILVMVIL